MRRNEPKETAYCFYFLVLVFFFILIFFSNVFRRIKSNRSIYKMSRIHFMRTNGCSIKINVFTPDTTTTTTTMMLSFTYIAFNR